MLLQGDEVLTLLSIGENVRISRLTSGFIELRARSLGLYSGGICSKESFVYRALSISITSVTRPSGLRNGNGLPVYLREMASIYLKSPYGWRSNTRRRSCAS